MPDSTIPAPARELPDAAWEHYGLYTRVRDAPYSLPLYFKTETNISGVMATDIFTLNTALGATIEEQVVPTLNGMRPIWDPLDRYRGYGFIRQAQTFPDVLLAELHGAKGERDILPGLELKGWYLLAKEGEPSFRFVVTAAACTIQDLIVVVPWFCQTLCRARPRFWSPL